ncbi:MAG: hypothetical protein WC445_04875 [Patescibacteria group bacterium]
MEKEKILAILAERIVEIERKNYPKADEMKRELQENGVMIYDVKHPVSCERFTFWQKDGVTTIFPHEVSPEDYALLKSAIKAKKAKK